jgi:hypothetical protein
MAMMVAMMDRRAVVQGFNAILFDVLKLHKKKEVYNRLALSCQTRLVPGAASIVSGFRFQVSGFRLKTRRPFSSEA